MAIDSANKRSSAINPMLPFRGMLPIPDGAIDSADRAHADFTYGGIAFVTFVVGGLELTIQADFGRDETFSGGDITEYILSAEWQYGMTDSYAEIAQPATATIVFSNREGQFNPENVGAELLTNGDFASWSGDNPASWSVTGESGSDPHVNEVGAGESNGGTGTGTANLYSSDTDTIAISQNILTSGLTYRCELNIDTAITGAIGVYSGTTLVSPILYTLTGAKAFYFVADSSTFKIQSSGATDITIDNVSVKLAGTFTGRLNKGVMMRIRGTFDNITYTLFQGRVASVQPTIGSHRERQFTVTLQDAMLDLLDAEFKPQLLTDTSADASIAPIFDEAVIPYPYPHKYWMLGVDGYSVLDSTTILYDHLATFFESGITEFNFTGDTSDTGKGISAQGFIRDMVGGEMGGRFFFDPRNNRFVFHNRHHDVLTTAISGVLTGDDFESGAYVSQQDLANHFSLNYTPREIKAAGSVLWSSPNVPFVLRAGEHRRINARYKDAENENARVGAKDFIIPTRGFDLVANTMSDGSGEDVTELVTISVDFKAANAEVFVENGSANEFYVTTLQLRGTPIVTFDAAFVEAFDGQSQADYSTYKKTLSVTAIDSEEVAQQYADYLLRQFKTPISRIAQLTFTVNGSDARTAQAVARQIGDRITVSDSWSMHSAQYIIVGIRQRLIAGGVNAPLETTFILKPAARVIGWILDSIGRSELGDTTILAF